MCFEFVILSIFEIYVSRCSKRPLGSFSSNYLKAFRLNLQKNKSFLRSKANLHHYVGKIRLIILIILLTYLCHRSRRERNRAQDRRVGGSGILMPDQEPHTRFRIVRMSSGLALADAARTRPRDAEENSIPDFQVRCNLSYAWFRCKGYCIKVACGF